LEKTKAVETMLTAAQALISAAMAIIKFIKCIDKLNHQTEKSSE